MWKKIVVSAKKSETNSFALENCENKVTGVSNSFVWNEAKMICDHLTETMFDGFARVFFSLLVLFHFVWFDANEKNWKRQPELILVVVWSGLEHLH